MIGTPKSPDSTHPCRRDYLPREASAASEAERAPLQVRHRLWRSHAVHLATAFALLALVVSCDEQLPEYADPTDLLVLRTHATYRVTQDENVIYLFVAAVNRFDETLEDTLLLEGNVTVTVARLPEYHRTFQLGVSQLSAAHYDSIRHVLRLDPGDTVVFVERWDMKDDSGRSLIEEGVFRFGPDPNCTFRLMAEKEDFRVEASVRLYRRSRRTVAPVYVYPVCYRSNYVPTRDCHQPVVDGVSLCY